MIGRSEFTIKPIRTTRMTAWRAKEKVGLSAAEDPGEVLFFSPADPISR